MLTLSQLQNQVKRDPAGYREEFFLQVQHFKCELDIFKLKPFKQSERYLELVSFLSHTVPCYKDETLQNHSNVVDKLPAYFSKCLLDILGNFGSIMHPEMRVKTFQALVLLRGKGIVQPTVLISLCFQLFNVPDKVLRLSLTNYIINDIKSMNVSRVCVEVNKSIQALLFNVVSSNDSSAALKTVEIISELYRRRIWTDERTVNILSLACQHEDSKVSVLAINFFLGIESKMSEDDILAKENDTSPINYHEHSKKTKKRSNSVLRQTQKNDKMVRVQHKKSLDAIPLFPAILLIHDPYSVTEKILDKAKSNERFEVKLLYMNFASRLIGCHKLQMFGFLSFIQRYLWSHQKDISQILAYLIQSTHDLIPPQEVLPVIQTIATNFINERCSDEVLTIGINTVREMVSRVPSILFEHNMDVLVQDIAMYSRKMHREVVSAAKRFITLIRDVYPALLRKQDRGRDSTDMVPLGFGQVKTVSESELYDMDEDGQDETIDEDDIDEDCSDGSDEDEDDEDNSEGHSENCSEYNNENGSDDDEEVDCFEVDDAINSCTKSIPRHKQIVKHNSSKLSLDSTDIQMIRRLKTSQTIAASQPDDDDQQNESFFVDPSSLEPSRKMRTQSKIERLTKMVERRAENGPFEYGGHRGGLTNKEKERKKNFVMVRRGKKEITQKILQSSQQTRYLRNNKKKIFGRDKRKRRRT